MLIHLLFDFSIVDEIRSVSVNERAERLAVAPRLGKVFDFDAGITVRQVLAPEKQGAPSRHLFGLTMA